MALLRVYQAIKNDVWEVTFVNDPVALSISDKKLMQQYGEPEINMGGTFTYVVSEVDHTFTLPNVYARIRTDFPYTQCFDSTSGQFSTNTQIQVLAYRDAIVSAFTSALTTLRENTDTFSGEQTYNI